MADVIRRYFEYRNYQVKFVMNITDIDDRIIKKAIDNTSSFADVAGKYTNAFLEDTAKLGINPASVHPRATEHMDEIIGHIADLVKTGAAYEVEGDVYFSVDAFPDYGKLSGKKLEDLIAGARVETNTNKRNPADFALWKAAKRGEPYWPSPWGNGRPGWHIECSAMSQKHLGDTFDIHAGGNDLIFPHHENEIAQSEALTHKPLAKYWIHFGFLNIDKEKMSKSLGNFLTARDILKNYSAEAIRFFYFQTQYRSPINFSAEGLEAATKGLQKLDGLMQSLATAPDGNNAFDIAPYEARFIAAMDVDFNSPAAFGVFFDLVRDVNSELRKQSGLTPEAKSAVLSFLGRTAGNVFGVLSGKQNSEGSGKDIADLVEFIISVRSKIRAEKLWRLSDFIRDGLLELGIALEDGKTGTTWKRN